MSAAVPRTLVLASDGVVLRAWVASLDRAGTAHVSATARSAAPDPRVALEEALGRLRLEGGVPRRAVLLTSDVTPALLSLPLPAGRARPWEQMHHLVRWELEPFFARHVSARTLGSILYGQGILDRQQVEEVRRVQAERRAAVGSREGRSARFGDIAVELGVATRDQVERALVVQARLGEVGQSDAYACGWSAAGGLEDDGGHSPWWAAGIARGRRAAWHALLRGQGLKPLTLLPLVGCAATLAREGPCIVLEVAPDRVAVTRFQGGVPLQFDEILLEDDGALASACREAVGEKETGPVLLTGPAADEGLAAELGLDVARDADAWLAPALLAGAGRGPAAAVRWKDPRPPLHRRPLVQAAALLLVVGGAVAGAEHHVRRQLDAVRGERAVAREEAGRLDAAVRAEKERGERIAALEAQIAAARDVQVERRERLRVLGSVLAARRTFIPAVLQAQARAMVATRRQGEEIVLRRTAEVRPGAVRVEGWAVSEEGVQRFTRELAQQVRGFDLRVKDHEMRGATGPYGLSGFAFGFVLVPNGAVEGDVQ